MEVRVGGGGMEVGVGRGGMEVSMWICGDREGGGVDRWRWVAVSLQDVNCVPFGNIGPKGIKLSPPHLCFLFPPPSHFTLLSLQISDEILLNGFLSLLLLLLLNQPCGGAAIHSSCFSHNSSWKRKIPTYVKST